MTSLNHYGEPELPSARPPSASQAAIYQFRNHYDDYQETFDEDSPYPEEELDRDALNEYDDRHFDSRARGSAALSSVVRQTPSPLRWAMQDLMESLDTMSPPTRFPPSPRDSWAPATEYAQFELEPSDTWVHPESRLESQFPDFGSSDCPYPEDMRPPPLLNYVDKMQAKLDRFNNSQYAPHRDTFNPLLDRSRPQSRLSNSSDLRPRSSHSVNKPLPQPPIPPPHSHRRQDTSSTTSHSTKYSIFSAGASDYSAASSASAGSAGSAGSFARKKARQRQAEEAASERSALTVLPKSQSNVLALKRRKSYGSSLKKTIGKLLNTSPTKPPPGSVTDHGDKIIEWQNVRRDVNRANTPSSQERDEHRERLEMAEGLELIRPIEILERIIEGDESANGSPILPDETFDISSTAPLFLCFDHLRSKLLVD
jgi:hypothetical protein